MVVDDNSSSNPRSRPTVTGAGVDTNTPNSATKTTTTTKTPSSSSPSSVSPLSTKKQKEINEEINKKTEKLANSSNGRNRTGAEKSTQDQGDTTNDKETKHVRKKKY